MANPLETPLTTPLAARGLVKRYGTTLALDGFDLTVAASSIHGLLGPNGAGKSTAVRCFATLTRYDAGQVTVAGHDVRRSPSTVRRTIGLVGQSAALDEILFGRENLVLFGRLHGLSARTAGRRADQLLEQFDLVDAAKKPVSAYSGGMRRRLDVAASLVLTPSVLFLDEPTTGLDPRGRNEVWETVRRVVAQGTTVLLTTQYLDEADQLADQISVMDHGRVIAAGSPQELKRQLGGDRVVVTLAADADPARARAVLADQSVHPVAYRQETRQASVEAGAVGGSATLLAAVRALDAAGINFDDVLLRHPTLDEVFLHLTSTHGTSTAEGAAR